MILSGNNVDYIRNYVREISNKVLKNEKRKYKSFGCYGYYDVFNGAYINSGDWIPPRGYEPMERAWYKAAVEADGEIAITKPYIDVRTSNMVVSHSIRLFDEKYKSLAVVSIDMPIEEIAQEIISMQLSDGGYGFLLNENFEYIAHPNSDMFGKSIRNVSKDSKNLADELERNGSVYERIIMDYRNKEAVVFADKMSNGWYLAVVTPIEKYYKNVRTLVFFLVLLGITMATVLSFALLQLVKSKNRSAEYSKLMFESIPIPCDLWDKNFKNIACNQENLRVFDVRNQQRYLEHFLEFSPRHQPCGKLSKDLIYEMLSEALATGYCRFEWMHQKLNGELLPCEMILARIEYKNDFIIAAYKYDLRKHKADMEKLLEADERMRILLDSAPFGVTFLDKDLSIIECNHELVRMLELSGKHELYNKFSELSPEFQPDGRRSFDKASKLVQKAFTEGFCRFEWVHQKLNGEFVPCEITLVATKYREEPIIAGYVHDLREYKAMLKEMHKAEIAEESNKARTKFLTMISHEIRTPVNAILGIAEIQLEDVTLAPETMEALNKIYASANLLLNIINDILDLPKAEAGKLRLSPSRYNVANLIHDVVQFNMILLGSKSIGFELQIDPNTPAELFGDELRIKQIFNGLFTNALRYTDSGKVKLFVRTEQKSASEIVLVIGVNDTGHGMTEEQIQNMFDESSSINTEANRTIQGTGLGMNITRYLIQMMNGNINVESEQGKGSAFIVQLPQGIVDSAVLGEEMAENLRQFRFNSTSQIRNAQIVREPMPYGSVLVVDDVKTNIYVAKELLQPYKLSIDTVDNGLKTIEKIKAGDIYDIIFMDHMMPGMDGIETLKIIRDLGYKHPIIALTANAVTGQAEIFSENGFDGFISKPIDVKQLNDILNKFIRDKQDANVIKEARQQYVLTKVIGRNEVFEIDPALLFTFAKDAKKILPILDATFKNINNLTDSDLHSLMINVHSIKSALANIGEDMLSSLARKLEVASREKNIEIIAAEIRLFSSKLRDIVQKIEFAEDEKSEVADEDLTYLREKLFAFKTVCIAYDKKNAKEILADIQSKQWSHTNNEMLESLLEHLLHSEFEEAAARATQFLETMNS
jgi:signal transduction histidine kinase/FixJ family two-component response regulator/HPt (histidine-containing phosphotransfer) domain-containing protein